MVGIRDQGERAQLILVGAIALAFLILGIVVVFNSAIYSQTAGQDGTVERAGEPAAVEAEVEAGVREFVRATNVEQDANGDGGDDTPSLDKQLSVFEDQYLNATAASRPVLVDLTLEPGDRAGTVVYQHEVAELIEQDGDGGSLVVGGAEDGYMDSFELTLSDLDSLAVVLDEDDRTIELSREGDIVTVGGDGPTCELEPAAEGDPVTLDLVTGETDAVADETCLEEHTLDGDEERIDFEGESAVGAFELVIVPDPSEEGEIESDFDTRDAVTSVEGTLTYESDELTYERDLEIDVYGDEP